MRPLKRKLNAMINKPARRSQGKPCYMLGNASRSFRVARNFAATINRFDTLRCTIEPISVKTDERIVRQIEHNDLAVPLKPIERAEAYKKLVDLGWTLERIGKAVGKTAQHVADYISMLNAPVELVDAVREERMSPTAAKKAARAKPEKKAAAIAKASRGERVKVKDVAEGGVLGIGDIKKAIKRADNYIYNSKKNTTEEARWMGVKFGLEIAAGMHDRDF